MRHPWRSLAALPRPAWVLLAATFLNRAGTMGLPFLVLYLTRERGWSDADAGAGLLLYGAGALAAAPLSARAIRRWNAVTVMKGSLVLGAAAQVAFPWCHQTVGIGALALIWGLLAEAFRPASTSLIADLVPAERHRQAYAALRLAGNLGTSIGPALGGVIATRALPLVFVVDGATSFVAALVLIRAVAPWPTPLVAHARATGALLRDRALVLFLIPATLVAMLFYQCESTMSLWLVSGQHMSTTAYGLLFTLNTVMVVVLEVVVTEATSRWRMRTALALGALLVGAGFGVLALVPSTVWAALSVIVWTTGEMLFAPTASAYAAGIAPTGRRPDYLAAYGAVWSVALALGPWLGTLSFAALGGRAHWALTTLVGVLAASVLFRTVRTANV